MVLSTNKTFPYKAISLNCLLVTTVLFIPSTATFADIVSFLVDPDTIDSNNDAFITGDEFQPVGSGGTIFDFTPTNNLVSFPRFQLSAQRGVRYGGGGGSSLEFTFSTDQDILLNSYTLASSGSILGDPTFAIKSGDSILSNSNTSIGNGNIYSFNSGPIAIRSGQDYTFEVINSGAAIQSYMDSWNYTVTAVPEPGAVLFLSSLCLVLATSRRKFYQAITGLLPNVVFRKS
jgi:hypothetical protein